MGQLQPGPVLAVVPMGQIQGMPEVILLRPRIPVDNGPDCMTFWDHGSDLDLLTFNYAARVGLEGVDCAFKLTSVGMKIERSPPNCTWWRWSIARKRRGRCAFGIKSITSELPSIKVEELANQFSGLRKEDIDSALAKWTCGGNELCRHAAQ
jgi:hypothetical protein